MEAVDGKLSAVGNLSGVASKDASLVGKLAGGASLSGNLSTALKLNGKVSVSETLTGGLSISTGDIPAYHGETTVVPSDEEQILSCSGFVMPADVIVKPIPSNYGKISWNSVTLTVS